MKKKVYYIIIILLLIIYIHQTLIPQNVPKFVEGQIILQLKEGIEINSILNKYAYMDLTVLEELWPESNIWLLSFNVSKKTNFEALEVLRSDQNLSFAQFNHYLKIRSSRPNDPFFHQQWSLNNTGQTGGNLDADIDALEAWLINTGGITATGDEVVIAVIDDGFVHQNYFKFIL